MERASVLFSDCVHMKYNSILPSVDCHCLPVYRVLLSALRMEVGTTCLLDRVRELAQHSDLLSFGCTKLLPVPWECLALHSSSLLLLFLYLFTWLSPLFPLGLSPKAILSLNPSYFRRPLLATLTSRVEVPKPSSVEFPFLSWKNLTWPGIPKYTCFFLPPPPTIAGGSFRIPPQASWTLKPCVILWCHHVVQLGSATEFSCNIKIVQFMPLTSSEREKWRKERCRALCTGERHSFRLALSLELKTSQHPL